MTEATTKADHPSKPGFGLAFRIVALAALFMIEKSYLGGHVDSSRAQSAPGLGAIVRAGQHWGFRFVVAFFASLLVLTYAGSGVKRLAASDDAVRSSGVKLGWAALHIALILCLVPLSGMLYPATPLDPGTFALVASSWIVIGTLAAIAALLTLGRAQIWMQAAQALGVVWFYAAIAALLGVAALQVSQQLWGPVASVTFALVRFLLSPILPDLAADASTRILSTSRFSIQIADYCSGLEGMTLILIFIAAWLLYFRREYRFPRALLLLPIGVITMFVLNAVRIALLMLVGYVGYPDVAAYGFHSQAGWIAFNVVACGVAFVSRRSAWLASNPARQSLSVPTENPTAAYLMPLLWILIAGIIARSMSSGFEAGYPLRLLAGAVALFAYRRRFTGLNWQVSWRGAALGAVIFLVWEACAHFLLAPAGMPSPLAAQSVGFRLMWTSCRVMAAVITVPLAEELAFRGFLMRRLVDTDFESVAFGAVRPFAVVVSAIVFGVSHGVMWPAAVVTGLALGFLLVRRGSMGEVVLAHGTANALIAVAVLTGGQWQLW